MDVFDLFAKLSLDTSEYDQGLKDAKSAVSSFGTGLANATRVGAAAIAAVGTAAIGVGTSLVNSTGKVAEYGDQIDKMSQKMGISAEAYQEWDAVMQHSGTSIAALKPSMKTLANAAQTGAEEFQKLGISQKEVASLSQEDLFAKVIEGLQSMEEGTERTAITSKLLGRGATELGALLNTSAEETQAMRDRVHELGGVMSDEAVKASAKYQDSLQDLTTGFDSMKRNLLVDFLPSITTVMDGLTNIFAGDMEGGTEQIADGIQQVIDNVSKLLPRITEVAVPVLEAIVQALIDNLPVILPALTTLVMGISDMIVQNLPFLVDTAMQMILTISQGIVDSLPTLIPTVVQVILQIVDTLIENIDLLVDAAIAINIALAEGLIDSLPTLIEKAPVIIEKLVDAIVRNIPKLMEASMQIVIALVKGIIENLPQILEAGMEIVNSLGAGILQMLSALWDGGAKMIETVWEGIKSLDPLQWGKDMIDSFIAGINDRIAKVADAARGIAKTVKDILGFSEPKYGPLADFHTYAPDMMELFAQGIANNEDMLQRQVEKSFNFGNIASMTTVGKPTNSLVSSNDMARTQTVILQLDRTELGRIVYDLNNEETRRIGVKLAGGVV